MTGSFDIAAAEKIMCRSTGWLRQHVHEIPHYRPGGQILFDEADLRKRMLRFKVESTAIGFAGVLKRMITSPRRQRGSEGRFRGEVGG